MIKLKKKIHLLGNQFFIARQNFEQFPICASNDVNHNFNKVKLNTSEIIIYYVYETDFCFRVMFLRSFGHFYETPSYLYRTEVIRQLNRLLFSIN